MRQHAESLKINETASDYEMGQLRRDNSFDTHRSHVIHCELSVSFNELPVGRHMCGCPPTYPHSGSDKPKADTDRSRMINPGGPAVAPCERISRVVEMQAANEDVERGRCGFLSLERPAD